MPKRATSLTGAAGEHYVAYVLSALGYPVGLTRGGSPTVDILVGDVSGAKSISIQVKTSNWAWRDYKKKTENNHWEWDVGVKAKKLSEKSVFYAFVDLKWNDDKPMESVEENKPDVYIVPSEDVAKVFENTDYSRYMFWIMKKDENKYKDNWDIIIEALSSEKNSET